MSRIDDPARLAAIERLGLDSGLPEGTFDRVVRLAGRLFDVPVVAVNLVESDRQVSLAQVGLDSDVRPLSDSICATAVETGRPLLLEDAATDSRFRSHPAVAADPPVRFYAGQPLRAHGEVVGTLCLADSQPRSLNEAEARMLADLASWVEQDLVADQEQREAREVQRRLLPRQPADVPGLVVAGHCEPARVVGGDFYDWQQVGDRLQVVLADVMGKGLTAAVTAAGVRAILRGTSPFNSVAASVSRAGQDSQQDLDETSTFVTMFAARIHPGTGAVDYVDAGHGLAAVLQPDGGVRRLRADGLPLGALPGDTWESSTDTLAPGETLLVVSDGVLDAFSSTDQALAAAGDLARLDTDPEDALRRVRERVAHAVSDDVTVVVVRRDAS